jgi:hypothetical protein
MKIINPQKSLYRLIHSTDQHKPEFMPYRPLAALLILVLLQANTLVRGQAQSLRRAGGFESQPSTYPQLELFAPEQGMKPVTLQTVWIFLGNEAGTVGFSRDDSVEQRLLAQARAWFSRIYRAPTHRPHERPRCYDGPVEDTYIRFAVHEVYLKDDDWYNNRNEKDQRYGCPGRPGWYLNELSDSLRADSTIPNGIQLFFTEDSAYAARVQHSDRLLSEKAKHDCSQFPSRQHWIQQKIHFRDKATYLEDLSHLPGDTASRFWDPERYFDPYERKLHWVNPFWWLVRELGDGLAHELGHSLGLHHFPQCPHHLMHTQPPTRIGDYVRRKDVRRMHRSIQTTSLRQYIVDAPAPEDLPPLEWRQDATIDHYWRPYRSLYVGDSTTLTITGRLEMPPGSFLQLAPTACLVLDGGRIVPATDEGWSGIRRLRRGWFGPRGEVVQKNGGGIGEEAPRYRGAMRRDTSTD